MLRKWLHELGFFDVFPMAWSVGHHHNRTRQLNLPMEGFEQGFLRFQDSQNGETVECLRGFLGSRIHVLMTIDSLEIPGFLLGGSSQLVSG